MYKYYFSNNRENVILTPAIRRKITEANLIENFHWLPQDIKKIPYNDLIEFLLISKTKNEAIKARDEVGKLEAQQKAQTTNRR